MDSSNVSASPTATDDSLKEDDGKKREVSPPEQEEAIKKRLKVADDLEETGEESDEDYKVCQFVVQGLKAGRGESITNYSVSMLIGKHGLFDLVLKVFEILSQENLTNDEHFDHLWSIVFDGTKYHNGWRESGIPDGPTRHIDEQDILPLQTLGLEQGQKGKFRGQFASFDFVVEDIDGLPQKDAQYPRYSAMPPPFSSLLSDDWISGAQITACLQARGKWQDFYHGDENSSKYDGFSREIVPCKPVRPQWNIHELQLLGLLINAGHKFTKSWKNVLQYALVRRPQHAMSWQWYKLQKEGFRLEYIGRGKSGAEMTFLAKKLAKSLVASHRS